MSKTQVKQNKNIAEGFIGSLLAGLSSAVLPEIVNKVLDYFSEPKGS